MIPSSKSLLLAFAIATLLVIPVVAENATYPQKYYDLGKMSEDLYNSIATSGLAMNTEIIHSNIVSYYELRRQTILMERQNELIAEQNKAIWVSTCYAPHTDVRFGVSTSASNLSALEMECYRAGYPTILG